MSTQSSQTLNVWKPFEKIALRSFLIYSIITFIPFAPSFYKQDFDAGFTVNSYKFRWLDVVSQNNPWFFSSQEGKNYFGWFITVLVCFLAGIVWWVIETQLSKNKNALNTDSTTDNKLYNWFFILLRYQIVLRMSWFAIAKLFPVQMPFPTIGQLNTNLGDFTPGKLYWLTVGVSPFFEVFAGIFELVATVLLLSRRTVTLGALMMIAILLPIWFVNIGYDAGVELASMHILLLSLLLLAKDGDKFYTLLIKHQQAVINYIQPLTFPHKWQRSARIILKVTFIFLFIFYRGYEYGKLYSNGKTFKLPLDNGLKSFTGFYNVDKFKINNKVIPYSNNDTLRWQNAAFEKFNTISVKINRALPLNTKNSIRTTEYYGNIGRLFYGYRADTIKHQLILSNRIDTSSHIYLNYIKRGADTLLLSGINETKDSIHVVLNKVNKVYPLETKRK